MARKFICIVTVLLIMVNITQIYGKTVMTKTQTEKYLYNIAYYEQSNITNPSFGSAGGEWMIMGLARYGAITDKTLSVYKSNLTSYLKACNGEISSRKYTEYARTVIALTAIEENPENFNGYNLLSPLAEYDKIVCQGLNGMIYALIALDCGNYKIPTPKESYEGIVTTRDKLVKTILNSQKQDGGWSFSGTKSDTDMTAMAIQALEPYRREEKVQKAIEAAMDRLSELQLKDGGYSSAGIKNCESTAQVLTALSVMNVSVEDKRFVKGNNTVLDGLMNYYRNGGFSHLLGGSINQLATEQAMYGLTAYYRNICGMNGLFEMKDKMIRRPIEIGETESSKNVNIENTNKLIEQTEKRQKNSKKTKVKPAVKALESEKATTITDDSTITETKKKNKKETETIIESKENGETVIVTKYPEKEEIENKETGKIPERDSDDENSNYGAIIVAVFVFIGLGIGFYIIKRRYIE